VAEPRQIDVSFDPRCMASSNDRNLIVIHGCTSPLCRLLTAIVHSSACSPCCIPTENGANRACACRKNFRRRKSLFCADLFIDFRYCAVMSMYFRFGCHVNRKCRRVLLTVFIVMRKTQLIPLHCLIDGDNITSVFCRQKLH